MGRRYTSQKKAWSGEDELGMGVVVGRGAGELQLSGGGVGGEGGPRAPCMGQGKDRTKDNMRGGHRWRQKALPSLKRGLYSILFAG